MEEQIPSWIQSLLLILAGGVAGVITSIITALFARKKEQSIADVNAAEAEKKRAEAEKERAETEDRISETVRGWMNDLKKDVEHLDEQNKCLDTRLKESTDTIYELRRDKDNLKDELAKLAVKYNDLNDKYKILSGQYDKLLQENVSLKKRVQEQEVQIRELMGNNAQTA